MKQYDIEECAARAKAAIEKMRATVRPGAQTGRGGKAAVLRAVREQLRGALQAEYTVPQLLEALREVFGGELAAKTVRAALRDDAAPSRGAAKATKRRRQCKATGIGAAPAAATAAPTAALASSPQPDTASSPVQSPTEGPPADAVSPRTDAAPPPAGSPLTPKQRAEFRIPEWADGFDLRPGETLDRYASRKRVAGRPRTPDELRKFIGET